MLRVVNLIREWVLAHVLADDLAQHLIYNPYSYHFSYPVGVISNIFVATIVLQMHHNTDLLCTHNSNDQQARNKKKIDFDFDSCHIHTRNVHLIGL